LLIGRRGDVVSKEEIFTHVWPSTVVEEANLRVQIFLLRRLLKHDGDVIKTIPGRGYVFTAEITIRFTEREVSAIIDVEAIKSVPITPNGLPAFGSSSRHKQVERGVIRTAEAAEQIVAVIDDDRDTREALDSLLRSAGWRVELFSSASEFLRSYKPDGPKCLVLDVMLPGRTGLDFIDDLVEAKIHLPVIFISGHADIPMSVRAMKAGAVEFLTKPVRHQDLLDAIRLAIGPGPNDHPSVG
jgi:DNA-binding response OmpR family regulator